MTKIFCFAIAALLLCTTTQAQEQPQQPQPEEPQHAPTQQLAPKIQPKTPPQAPRLVVQIVVSSMRADDINRYAANFGSGGFLRLRDGGTVFTDCRYDYQQTTTPVSLATLTTGALPSTHGVIATHWRDYVENEPIDLIRTKGGISPRNLIAPTLGEALTLDSPESRIATVAMDPESAVVMAGRAGQAFWMENMHCNWETSMWYDAQLPVWLRCSNQERFNLSYLNDEWSTILDKEQYINKKHYDITLLPQSKKAERAKRPSTLKLNKEIDRMHYTPAGNNAVIGLAKQLVTQYKLGADKTPDLLNICLDAPRSISEAYGPESVEVEDMYYRLDRDLADLLTFLDAQAGEGNVLVVLTSDHGTSPSYDTGREVCDRFNIRQFEVIVNSFLNVRYGVGNWVLEYEDKCLYLDHNLIYERGLNLAEVQNEAAIFIMQFRGVSHALSASAMRTSYFGSGYARKMQNSFYPRRSGDVIINLMPGWIEERERTRSSSGSMYGYDTDVPLIIYGCGTKPQSVDEAVDMTSVAPTLARLLGVREPAASEGSALPAIVNR
ncbi:MAG: alkaline phosphatase family protein [Alistipes sp.]